jgi:hypothetical protein
LYRYTGDEGGATEGGGENETGSGLSRRNSYSKGLNFGPGGLGSKRGSRQSSRVGSVGPPYKLKSSVDP